ncbi:MAG: ATP-binding cassette domain-containing protein [Polyangiaceae bacterium]
MPALELLHLTKVCGPHLAVPHTAVDDVSLAFEAGRIHAILGENGAGKTTLLKMAAGLDVPTKGDVLVAGERLAPFDAKTAIRRGVGMVEQHFALVPELTALENVILGSEPTGLFGMVLDLRAARAKVIERQRRLGLDFDLDAPVHTLGVGEKQRVEIVRTLYRDARVLILDEPTALLAHAEAERLYATLRTLADAGALVIVVTHKLDEVRAFADHVSILRKGKLVLDEPVVRVPGADPASRERELRRLSEAIMGGDVPESKGKELAPLDAEPTLRLVDATCPEGLRGITLDVRPGEIVGVAGIEGNGQRELVRLLDGSLPLRSGTAILAGHPLPSGTSSGRARATRGQETGRTRRVSVVHEDRQREGLVLDATVADNLVLGELPSFSRHGWVDADAVTAVADARLREGRVVPPELDRSARTLSGGNQQKIVVERAVSVLGEGTLVGTLLVLAHPTRGVDLGASHVLWDRIRGAAARGAAVLVVSSDLHELRELASVLHVLREGRLVARFEPSVTDAEIGRAMVSGGAREVRP